MAYTPPFSPYPAAITPNSPLSSGSGMDPITLSMLVGGGLNFLGGLFGGNAQQNMNEEQIKAALKQAAAQMGMNEAQFSEMLRQSEGKAAVEGVQQTPNRVGWRQNQAMAAAILPGLRNTSVSSGIPGMNHFVPQVSGGLRIPEGGFGPDTMKFFGENAMLSGEQDLDRAVGVASNGRAPVPSYGSVYGQPGTLAEGAMAANSEALRKQAEEREKQRRAAIQQALGGTLGRAVPKTTPERG